MKKLNINLKKKEKKKEIKKEYDNEKTEVIHNLKEIKDKDKKVEKKEEVKEEKQTKSKKTIDNKILNFIIEHKIFLIIDVIFLILTLLCFKKKMLFGIISLVIFIAFIILYVVFGGRIMKKKKKKHVENNEQIIKKKKRRRRKIFKFLFNSALVMLLLALIGAIVFAIYIVINAPDFDPDNLYRAESSIIYDKDGNQIAKIGIEKRKKVEYEDLPQVLIDAIIATEDSRYYQHNGFDLPRFAKASFGQVVNKITGHGNAGGGSTISMQVVKNNFTDTEQTITRKFTDIYISVFKLEKNYSKEEILEYYVNTPFLGNSSYGVEQACQSYFGKSVSDINLSEAAIIAGLFQAPSSYDPYRYPENTEERRETVLYLMRMHGYITEEEEKMANSIPVESLLRPSNPEFGGNPYQSFIDIVLDEVEEKTKKSPYTTGMKIYTTLDQGKQNVINDIMSGASWEWQDPYVQAGVGVVDTQTGAILAIGGGRGRTGERQFNFATMLNKQIGSTAKPIFDYGPGIEYNNFCESTPFNDDTYTYSSGAALKNWDGGYQGVITLKKALAESRNIPAVKAFQSVENAKIKEFVTNLGMTPEIDSEGNLHEAHALGAFTGTNPVQLAGAYAAFGNGGYFTKPYSVSKVEYIDSGKTVSLKNKKKKVMEDSTAYMITDVLLYAVESYGNIGGTIDGVRFAAKTGTTNYPYEVLQAYGFPSSAINDLWSAGYSPEISVALWYGYDTPVPGYYNTGGYEKNNLYRFLVSNIVDRSKNQSFEVPGSVVSVTVEKETYPVELPSDNTPDDMKVTDYCKAGTAPTTVSVRYNRLDNVTNLSVKENSNNITLSWSAASEPKQTSFDYFKEYYKVLYAQHIEEKFAYMQAANGPFGYEISARNNSTGYTEVLGFTSSTTFTVDKEPYDTTYFVKTKYQNNDITKSTGAAVDVKGDISVIDPDDYTMSFDNGNSDTVTLDDTGSATYDVSNEGITVFDKNNNNITGQCGISRPTKCNGSSDGCSVSDGTATFTKEGTYKLEFNITYKGVDIGILTKTITVKK